MEVEQLVSVGSVEFAMVVEYVLQGLLCMVFYSASMRGNVFGLAAVEEKRLVDNVYI